MSVKFWRRPNSGRSCVYAKNGIVSTSQPLATSSGLEILRAGGNACDAIITMASVLNVVEPFSTGIGGDAFALIYIPGEKIPKAINGSGFSPKNLSYKYLVEEKNFESMPTYGVLPITIPGAVSAWETIHNEYGILSWKEVLQPAIRYAEEGFPISPLIAQVWSELVPHLLLHKGAQATYLLDGNRSPLIGEIFKQKALAETLKNIAKEGSQTFYNGEVANQIESFINQNDGFLTADDLSNFKAEWTKPISCIFNGYKVWEHGPNGQGLITLLILSIAEEYDIGSYPHNSIDYLHCLIEAKKLAFADAFEFIADPKWMSISVEEFLSDSYIQTRMSQINPRKALTTPVAPLDMGNDTVYLTAIDKEGVAVSFINSLFYGFGSGLVDPKTGIVFQNRGAGFSLRKGHANQYEPRKRPYHTIIPSMVTSLENELIYSFGVMGGHHQPQGQAQVLLNLILFDMDPQEAIEKPRFHHDQSTNTVALEEPIDIAIRAILRKRGHNIVDCVGVNFGGGQIIKHNPRTGIYSAGSDPRKDGQAQGY